MVQRHAEAKKYKNSPHCSRNEALSTDDFACTPTKFIIWTAYNKNGLHYSSLRLLLEVHCIFLTYSTHYYNPGLEYYKVYLNFFRYFFSAYDFCFGISIYEIDKSLCVKSRKITYISELLNWNWRRQVTKILIAGRGLYF